MIICNLNICWTSLLVLTLVILFAMSSDAGEKYVSVDFEYTEEEGKKLGVTGWVKNTRQGTVIGQVQGPPEKVKEMKYWLSKVGSPSSRIHRAQFTNERDISKLEIRGFGTRY
ncbi:acylphosphatase-2 isoform X2 [Ctenopharyngodon idella]|uniref:acylphosphatase-2 isoform X2 n=1 Tax=Ctenopharyngodon idella TaxID=7959 RepID=UPI002232815A|nr:acylphosphatase-2 isoform X2 [Ctenopharyngodon idella]